MTDRIDTTGQPGSLGQNPFGALRPDAFPKGTSMQSKAAGRSIRKQPNTNRGRVDVSRQTAGRGGKTVTVIAGFKGIGERELSELARTMQRACGTGGTVKDGRIEIQGDQRERAAEALTAAGFRPVMAGG